MDAAHEESGHKRKKSSIAKSLLHRSSSKQDLKNASEAGSPNSSPSSSSPTNGRATAGRHRLSLQPSHQSHRSNHSHHTSAHGSSVNISTDPPHISVHQPNSSDSPVSPTAAVPQKSLEQSVKLFRIFEALKNGDQPTILKALQGSQAGVKDAAAGSLEGTSILHLAVQCADLPILKFILDQSAEGKGRYVNVNARDRNGNTPLHIAASLGRNTAVRMLLDQEDVISSISNYRGQTPLDNARTPEIYQQIQLAQTLFHDSTVNKIHELITAREYDALEEYLAEPSVKNIIDVNGPELATEVNTVTYGGTLLHEAARKKDTALIQMLLLNGADPFQRDRKGKLPQDVTKDDRTRAILKRSPAAVAAQRGIQEKTILGSSTSNLAVGNSNDGPLGSKESREMKGYLKKWTNYTSGYKLRWFVLEDGVLSYYKHQDDAGSACRGAINMKIAKLYMDPQDKLRFEIQGKSSVKYHLKANHQVEAKRWFWALNNAIQWGKEESKQEEKKHSMDNEALRQARLEVAERSQSKDGDSNSMLSSYNGGKTLAPLSSLTAASSTSRVAVDEEEENEGGYSTYAPSAADDLRTYPSGQARSAFDMDANDEDDHEAQESSREVRAGNKDAFNIIAQSAKLQLDLIDQLASGLQAEQAKNPEAKISDPVIAQTLASYGSAVANLKGFVGDMFRISRDRDAYWQHRLNREVSMRRVWEESMARVAKEQEALETKIGESESKRKRTKRALKEALESQQPLPEGSVDRVAENESQGMSMSQASGASSLSHKLTGAAFPLKKKPTMNDLELISQSESDAEEEFYDAVDSGEVEVVSNIEPVAVPEIAVKSEDVITIWEQKKDELKPSFQGYEDPPREALSLSMDKRPKVSLWGILKSMVGQDMTKITLPAAFNEPTSLLQRIAEDMEYSDLLETAASRTESTERMVYVAAFATSEYASTIGRVAKPFNPLLGETFEYARPEKGYRFFIEQVSHHPPIGACHAESPKWEYYGESNVRSKFSGKSFDIGHLGTWFLKLRSAAGVEMYTWKKATSSVVGIITGNPTVDHYGTMEIKNWTTGEVAVLEFKPRGWKASSAYQVSGKVLDKKGEPCWSIDGRWNSKLYARLTPGSSASTTLLNRSDTNALALGANQAVLVWEAHERPSGIPFNLTPFVLTLNAITDRLKSKIAPTDTRLRPDQRAMEDGDYDFAASEKIRLEEEQRARRRERELKGEEYVPRWFKPAVCQTTGEKFWEFTGDYWKVRKDVAHEAATWDGLEKIF